MKTKEEILMEVRGIENTKENRNSIAMHRSYQIRVDEALEAMDLYAKQFENK